VKLTLFAPRTGSHFAWRNAGGRRLWRSHQARFCRGPDVHEMRGDVPYSCTMFCFREASVMSAKPNVEPELVGWMVAERVPMSTGVRRCVWIGVIDALETNLSVEIVWPRFRVMCGGTAPPLGADTKKRGWIRNSHCCHLWGHEETGGRLATAGHLKRTWVLEATRKNIQARAKQGWPGLPFVENEDSRGRRRLTKKKNVEAPVGWRRNSG